MENEFKTWTPEEVLEMQWQSFREEAGLTKTMLQERENAQPLMDQLKQLYQTMGGDTAKYHQHQEQLNLLIRDACKLPLKFE